MTAATDGAKFEQHHLDLLEAAAIPPVVAAAAGVRSVTDRADLPAGLRWDGPGLVFIYHPLDGSPVPQYRPDAPTADADGNVKKYVFRKGNVPLNIVSSMKKRIGKASTVLIVEGTKQTLTAVAHAAEDVLVVGMAGCWAWSADGMADPVLGQLGIDGANVVVALDADHATNPKVHDAGHRLADHLELLGAETVQFLKLPASANVGLDDYLATVPDPGAVLARLIAKATKLGRKPKGGTGTNGLFDSEGIRVAAAIDKIRETWPLLVDQSGRIATYADGVYRADRNDAAAWDAIITGLLGDAYRSHHYRTLTEFAAGRLRADGLAADDDPHPGLVNVANGMLDPVTGTLVPHDPKYRSVAQMAVNWNPKATSPVFDAWLPTVVALGLVDDLLESASLILETRPNRLQRRALFIHGPSRSGKSTFLRILERLVGQHRSAVTMAELGHDTFAAADLMGALLNSAADLSAAHLEDLSLFKALTGDDPVRAQRKYGQPFTFRARCLFVFSANAIPTAGEVFGGLPEPDPPGLVPDHLRRPRGRLHRGPTRPRTGGHPCPTGGRLPGPREPQRLHGHPSDPPGRRGVRPGLGPGAAIPGRDRQHQPRRVDRPHRPAQGVRGLVPGQPAQPVRQPEALRPGRVRRVPAGEAPWNPRVHRIDAAAPR